MLARLYVIIQSEEDKDYQKVKDELLTICPQFSVSPYREYAGMKGHSKFISLLIYQRKKFSPS